MPSIDIALEINGASVWRKVDTRATLLDLLRDDLALSGTKKGCGHGQCGACTIHLDGEAHLSCLTLAVQCDMRRVDTIEEVAPEGGLHPLQQAFIRHDAFQCGYCTPGQIMAALALIQRGRASDPEAVAELMSGNLCRCGAYEHIVAAIVEVAGDAAPAAHRLIDGRASRP